MGDVVEGGVGLWGFSERDFGVCGLWALEGDFA